jgi:hypothetical protein
MGLTAVAPPLLQAPMPEGAVIVTTGLVIEAKDSGLPNASETATVSGSAAEYCASIVDPLYVVVAKDTPV